MSVIETKKLTRMFNSFIAVNEISFSIEKKEVFGLLGPNGAGKTTTIKMLTTLLPPTSGLGLVAGFDICKQPAKVRRVVGYVPQFISADGTLSGYENLLIFAKLYDIPAREREKSIHAALEFMGLENSADKLVRQFSGGMVRRLEIAQSILHRPQVLFLDEPTIGLDPNARRIVWDHIRQLQKEFGTSILLTTHDMEEADSLCDRVAIMNLGVIASIGSPKALKASIHKPHATLDDVFIQITGGSIEGGNLRDTARTRRVARRLG
jgi:ABC-2 type transport system ATP-binding protein